MSKPITESEIEEVALDILTDLGYQTIFGPNIASAFAEGFSHSIWDGISDGDKWEQSGSRSG